MPSPQDDVLVTTAQAARFLGVSEASVIRWANRGAIPHVRTGAGHRRFRLGDLSTFLKTGRYRAPTEPGQAIASGS